MPGVIVGGYTVFETSIKDWKWVIDVNLWGVIHSVMTFGPIMLKQDTECHIVNTSSMGGFYSVPYTASYNVTKHGIVTLSETLYHELISMGAKVGVSVLCPALVDTRLKESERNRPTELQNDPAYEEQRQMMPRVQMMKQLADEMFKTAMSPQKVADIVFNAVIEGKFYIITEPEALATVQTRMEDILQQRQPTFTIPASFRDVTSQYKEAESGR
jgi:short-subunit dehydrogenase